MKWDDATSYSRDKPRGETQPRAWRARITADVSIWVGSEHLYYEGQWVMHCRPWFETKPLGMSAADFTAEQAQARAIELVCTEVNKLHAALACITLEARPHKMSQHASGCATHNMPALPAGQCDCGNVTIIPPEGLSIGSVWQPIETAPLGGTEVILFYPHLRDGGFVTAGYFSGANWYADLVNGGASPPTHWMPLPVPPNL